MRAAVFNEPRSVTVVDRRDPVIVEPTDAIVRVVLACVCGSDLWYYRGESPFEPGPIGHELIGVVEDVGREVRNIKKGDFVVSPFAFSDGTCPHCRHGITSACTNGGFFPSNGDGAQGEAVRVPLADGTLVTVPGSGHSDDMMVSLLTLSDVLATGHHAAVCADVKPGTVVAVVGDGAVGLSGVLAASRLGAQRVIALSRNPVRQALAREFGATDIVEARGEEATAAVQELTAGVGADAVMECVGTAQAMQTALSIARPGSMVGYVGVPHDIELPIGDMFFRNVGVRGGSAPVRAYIPELLDDVLEGRINPGRVFDFQTDLDGVAEAYAAMDERRAIKSLLRVGDGLTMRTWTREQLAAISAADELRIATRRRDGTLRDAVTIWSVPLGDDLYVRSVNGPTAAWYKGAQSRHEARISAGGVEQDVSLVETTEALDEIDAAYRAKYGRRYPTIVPSIVAPQARAATLKLEPRS